jgi:hypothetical protein
VEVRMIPLSAFNHRLLMSVQKPGHHYRYSLWLYLRVPISDR